MVSRSVFEIVVLAAVVALYFLPALIADRRARHDLLIIAVFNALMGWTLIGWLLALFWALQPNPPKDLGDQTTNRRRRLGMQLFSRRLDDRVQARNDRSTKHERSSR